MVEIERSARMVRQAREPVPHRFLACPKRQVCIMIKGICPDNIGIDRKDAQHLQRFYADLLSRDAREIDGCPAVCGPDGIVFLFDQSEDHPYVPPVWPEESGAQQKQMHMDFLVDDLPCAIRQAEAFDAVMAPRQYGGERFVTFFDPEGHPFCLGGKSSKG